jgi:hypothetical protein
MNLSRDERAKRSALRSSKTRNGRQVENFGAYSYTSRTSFRKKPSFSMRQRNDLRPIDAHCRYYLTAICNRSSADLRRSWFLHWEPEPPVSLEDPPSGTPPVQDTPRETLDSHFSLLIGESSAGGSLWGSLWPSAIWPPSWTSLVIVSRAAVRGRQRHRMGAARGVP